jgi:hypothetical protein
MIDSPACPPVTVAVNVTALPNKEGFAEDDKAIDGPWKTHTQTADDVLSL